LNPLGLIASGALLMAVAPQDTAAVRAALAEVGISATEIGRVAAREQGVTLRDAAGRRRSLPHFQRDEIVAALESG
jgi:hydrogenase maturation factor